MSTTMKEIAKLAGVNVSTVSRALNNDSSISEAVKKKIQKIAQDENYKRKKTPIGTISYVTDQRYFSTTSQFYSAVIEGIESECKKKGYIFQFESLGPKDSDPDKTNVKNSAGIIFASWFHDEFIIRARDKGIPTVLLDYYIPGEDFFAVLPDKVSGVIKSINYLVSLGHTRILYLMGKKISAGCYDRIYGVFRGIEINNLEKDDSLLLECDYTINSAYEVTTEYFRENENTSTFKRPTAILGGTDVIAIGAMEAVKVMGYNVPRDITIMGFDDISIASEVIPALTTMHVQKKRLGSIAVQILEKVIEGKSEECYHKLIQPFLIIRDSSSLYTISPRS